MKISIIGVGFVGSAIAYRLSHNDSVSEINLIDIDTKKAEGEAMDIQDTLYVESSKCIVSAGGYDNAGDSDLIVITAGVNDYIDDRSELIIANTKIYDSIVANIASKCPDACYLVVTNPVDSMALYLATHFSLSYDQVIGSGTVLDTSRLIHEAKMGVVIGEHGDTQVHVGVQQLESVVKRAKAIKLNKGVTQYGIASSVNLIVNQLTGKESKVLPVSTYHHASKLYYSWPCIYDKVNKKWKEVELELSQSEINRLNISKIKLDPNKLTKTS